MTRTSVVAALAATILVVGSAPAFAQAPSRPTRPTGSYGQPGQRPAGLPQRPPESYGQRGKRPEGIPQRPPESYGQRGKRPEGLPQRPPQSYGRGRGGGRGMVMAAIGSTFDADQNGRMDPTELATFQAFVARIAGR